MLTPKQKAILDFIGNFYEKNGYSPSQTEIAKAFGFRSLGTVQNYLVRLERHGVLRKSWNARRGMQALRPPTESLHFQRPIDVSMAQTIQLPLLGRVAAGLPIEVFSPTTEAGTPELFDVPASLLRQSGEHFVLKVAGSSMIEDGILNGDFVVLRKQSHAENGETVVALLNGQEATIKTYYRRGEKIELHPANPAFAPIVVQASGKSGSSEEGKFRIEGILVGIVRKF